MASKKNKKKQHHQTRSENGKTARAGLDFVRLEEDDFFAPAVGEIDNDSTRKQRLSLWKRSFWITILSTAAISSWMMSRPSNKPPTVAKAYVEVRAIDKQGFPVSGAELAIDQIGQGVTDSFGEWRSYMDLPVQTPISIAIRKDLSDRVELGATKNVIIEKPQGHQAARLMTTIELQTTQKALATKKQKKKKQVSLRPQ